MLQAKAEVQYLEQRWAELQWLRNSSGDDYALTRTRTAGPEDPAYQRVIDIAAVSVSPYTTPSLIKSYPVLQHEAKLFYSSERPPLKIPVHGNYYDMYPRTAGQEYAAQFSQFNAQKIPLEVAKRLFAVYKDNILPRFPSFMEEDLDQQFDLFYGDNAQPSNTTTFIVTLILAIGSMTSKRHEFRKIAALTEALHADAMRHIGFLGESSLTTLQCLLLLIQCALLLPHTANLWYMSGEAMRMAISLGLHQEPDLSTTVLSSRAELRRRIFWVTYDLERLIAISNGCPVAISDDHISTQLPFGAGSTHDASDIQTFLSRVSRASEGKQFLVQIMICFIQTEILSVQFFDQPIPDNKDHNSWVSTTEESIHVLLKYANSEGITSLPLISAAHQCQISLHRPCSRNIAVSESLLIKAVTASIQLIDLSIKTISIGGFILTFSLACNSFHAGVVLLYALRNHTLTLQQADLIDQSNHALEQLCKLMELLSSRWPALSDTAKYIKELIDTNLRNPINDLGTEYDMSVLEELDFLVTQRRIHSLYHRNLPVPNKQASILEAQAISEISPGFLHDDSWWDEFIVDDFDMFANQDSAAAGFSFATPTMEIQVDETEPSTTTRPPKRKGTDLDEILEALPSCSSCRDRRIKCDRQLPACTYCKRTNRDCAFFDPVLSENISFRRVHCLVENIKKLTAEVGTNLVVSRRLPSLATHTQNIVLMPFRTVTHCPQDNGILPSNNSVSFFGPWTLLGSLRELFHHESEYDVPEVLKQAVSIGGLGLNIQNSHVELLSPSTTLSLLHLFSRSAHAFFPVLDETALQVMFASLYSIESFLEQDRHGIFYLVLAIASSIAKKSEPTLACWAPSFFNKAIEKVTVVSDHSRTENIALFQRTLLICVYLLLNPDAGDIWRHLGFAIRLFLDISHRPSEDEVEDHHLFCMLTRTMYCLESQVSVAYGRPSLLVFGDSLRQEQGQTNSNTIREGISIYFYLISFHKMKIHSALLKRGSLSDDPDQSQVGEYKRDIEEWFVLWKELVTLLAETEDTSMSYSWASTQPLQHHYEGSN
ncbi:uncharacterized protein FMAN_08412 [Fusarium mangiferae]|uniref:Zn(2)-C6 fungal-type domain-containing protein n=1 Tax=Fusarium mangiferae TaxID=192010 RepID=A0A1L7TU06_FUSMA|nr:uncharacterized protein FMAN_08412 [Fusarium mangiferae]CVK98837.1 uncharacterized protein FMAN_08412 [Fusarium mangiferae]